MRDEVHTKMSAKELMLLNFVLEKTVVSTLDARRSNQSILKEISPEYSLEELMLKVKLQYIGHLMRATDSLEKTPMQEEKGTREDEMIGWHH